MPEALHTELLTWGVPRLRDLPWRNTRDPWAVLVAEVMLQQTQTQRVIPKWLTFLDAFPTAEACASAPLGDVLRRWEGLGYPRRARNLHQTAALVAIEHGGRWPTELAVLLALPGIGPYTARAVLAFAFEADVAIVDTNVARILARVSGRSLTARAVQAMADDWLAPGESWVWNQTMLDLGATVCTARSPRCADCPIASRCAWQRSGTADPDPAVGSAGVSGVQSRFEGSDRQLRGRLLRALAQGPIEATSAAAIAGILDGPRAARVLESLIADGLAIERAPGRITLP